jgi:hypothetical protein
MILGLSDKLIIGGVLVAAVCTGLFIFALHQREIGRDKYIAQVEKTQMHYKGQAKKVTIKVVTEYIHDTQVIKEKGDTIIKKVPVYVTVKDDRACTINNGFVSLWNSANTMRVPNTSARVNAAPSSIVLSDVAAQHVTEANICHGTERQLKGLQDWVRGIENIK